MSIKEIFRNIFNAMGWKIIAFNEFFDTTVDDKIITHNTLNGIFIDNYVENLDDLQNAIANETDNPKFKRSTRYGRFVYPLGRIITYKDFMLLATILLTEEAIQNINIYEMKAVKSALGQ